MNPIAQQALAKALTRGPKPVPVADVLLEQAPVTRPVTPPVTSPVTAGDRVSYLEGRRHASEIVLAANQTLNTPDGARRVLDSLRSCMQGKPASFARGVAEIIELLEQEVGRG